ncbi:MAG: hypothetical protein AAFV07_02880, partial [Bacteroidota bacterium]
MLVQHGRPGPQHPSISETLPLQDRQLPPTLSQTISVATQADAAQRLALQWERLGNSWMFRARAAMLNEQLQFIDSIAAIDADN